MSGSIALDGIAQRCCNRGGKLPAEYRNLLKKYIINRLSLSKIFSAINLRQHVQSNTGMAKLAAFMGSGRRQRPGTILWLQV
jgi:hypothetical protein